MKPMRRLHLALCCFLSCFCLASLADEAAVNEPRPVTFAQHNRQEKFAGRAVRQADAAGAPNQAAQSNGEVRERKALTKEERRALRAQVNASMVRYPRRH